MKPGRFFIIVTALLLTCATAQAYRMPEYHMSASDWSRPSDEILAEYGRRMNEIASVVPLTKLESYRSCTQCRLSRSERAAYLEYMELKVPYEFWDYVVKLKKDLFSMTEDQSAEGEADLLAKKIIQKIYDLSNEYKIIGSALVHNLLINAGVREKGFCYHYTDALRSMVRQTQWQHFDFHWGAAWDQTFRENNGLVITAKGKPFKTGIVVDPWRAASKPYWHTVTGDRFPWTELHDVQIANP